MKKLYNVISKLEKETRKKELAENKIRQLRQKKSQLKRKADTKRKVEKGGVFESFEREITGSQEDTDNDLVYEFLDYVLSDNRNREKLRQHTEIYSKEQKTGSVENQNLDSENIRLEDEETKIQIKTQKMNFQKMKLKK